MTLVDAGSLVRPVVSPVPIRAAPRVAVSHRVPGRAACLRRLYYTRYLTRSSHQHEPADVFFPVGVFQR